MIMKHKITTDFINPNNMADDGSYGRLPQLHMVQGDIYSRAVELEIKVDGQDWDTSVVQNVFVQYRKPDGTGGSYDSMPTNEPAWSAEGNVITVMIAPQVLAVPGVVTAQVMLIAQGRGLATFHFQIIVEEDVTQGIVESEDYISWVSWAQNELDNRLEEAWKSGRFHGEDGEDGADGAIFTPSVSQDGILSWSNDQGKENPEAVNVLAMLVAKLGLTGSTFAPGGYGLGGSTSEGMCITSLSGLDAAVANGWYLFHCDNTAINSYSFSYAALFVSNVATDNAVFQELRIAGTNYVLKRYRGADAVTWGPWEWENPPMAAGVEYRTTERWLGKTVYAKVIDCGAMADQKGIDTGYAQNEIRVLRCSGTCGKLTMTYKGSASGQWDTTFSFINMSSRNLVQLQCGSSIGSSQTYVQIWFTKD